MPGAAAVAIWCDIGLDVKDEFDDWHAHEHLPERLSIPGFLRGSRWRSAEGGDGYFMLYEAESLDVISSGPYLARLNDPTPWSRKMMPHHRNMVRSLCNVTASVGAGLGQYMLTVRSASRIALPQIARGIVAAQLLVADNSKLATQTAEQKIRGGDGTADQIMLVTGYDRGAFESLKREGIAGLYVLSQMLTPA